RVLSQRRGPSHCSRRDQLDTGELIRQIVADSPYPGRHLAVKRQSRHLGTVEGFNLQLDLAGLFHRDFAEPHGSALSVTPDELDGPVTALVAADARHDLILCSVDGHIVGRSRPLTYTG